MKTHSIAGLICLLLHPFAGAIGQAKTINHQYQSWVSINTTARLSGQWGLIADVHMRRNHFAADPGFYFVRGAVNYWVKENLTIAAGYGHMWVAPAIAGYHTYANENRVYQQVQLLSKMGRCSMVQRLRNEQRWQEIIVKDVRTHTNKFSNRVRYLLSVTIPVTANKHWPSLVVADELCVQFGKQVVYNTFDQNRIFVGLKQPISKHCSADIGYMNVFQQKSSGDVYDDNDTFRLFFYFTPDLRRKNH